MTTRSFVFGLAALSTSAAFAWPFDNASDNYEKASYELECCMAKDSLADSAGSAACPGVKDDTDYEAQRARDLCITQAGQARKSNCDYETLFPQITEKRNACLEEASDEKCGAARSRGMAAAQKACKI